MANENRMRVRLDLLVETSDPHALVRGNQLRCAGTDIYRAGTLLSALQLKLDPLAFLQTVEIQTLEVTSVKKNLLPILGPDKTESAVADHSFNSSIHNTALGKRESENFLAGWNLKPARNPLD